MPGQTRLGERIVARELVGDKNNSVVADSILWFESDDTVAWASVPNDARAPAGTDEFSLVRQSLLRC
jgi:hypothetical protein